MQEATFKIAAPDAVPCDLGARMTLGEWKQVREALVKSKANAAATQFVGVIDRLVNQAEFQFSEQGRVSELKEAA